jgi:hypothetical protein
MEPSRWRSGFPVPVPEPGGALILPRSDTSSVRWCRGDGGREHAVQRPRHPQLREIRSKRSRDGRNGTLEGKIAERRICLKPPSFPSGRSHGEKHGFPPQVHLPPSRLQSGMTPESFHVHANIQASVRSFAGQAARNRKGEPSRRNFPDRAFFRPGTDGRKERPAT